MRNLSVRPPIRAAIAAVTCRHPIGLDSPSRLAFTFIQSVTTTAAAARVSRQGGKPWKRSNGAPSSKALGSARSPSRSAAPMCCSRRRRRARKARRAGIANFIDQQISIPAEEALLEARILNVKPPYANFYRAAIGAINNASTAKYGKRFAELDAATQHDLVDQMRQNKLDGWQGPPGPFVYLILRSDAVDVVYGTMSGYASLDI